MPDLAVNSDPHRGADGIETAEDIVTELEDVAAKVDIGGTTLIVAGRPQPPPAEVAIIDFQSAISNCIIRRLTLSCAIGAKISLRFPDAKQEHLILRCITGIFTVRNKFC